jgi:hypothetical protein
VARFPCCPLPSCFLNENLLAVLTFIVRAACSAYFILLPVSRHTALVYDVDLESLGTFEQNNVEHSSCFDIETIQGATFQG